MIDLPELLGGDPIHPATLAFYDGLGPRLRQGDRESGWMLLSLVDAFIHGAKAVWDLVTDTVVDGIERPGWYQLWDAQNCPPSWLPWLTQTVGQIFDASVATQVVRDRIDSHYGWGRDTPANVKQAVAATLDPGAPVVIDEQFGDDPYTYRVRTFTSSTPDETATAAAVAATTPAPLKSSLLVADGATWSDMVTHLGATATFADLAAAFTTWADAAAYI